jgi:hypothetical protein
VFAIRHPRTVRWRDVFRICEQVGADALPIVALISFLLGMILAFQSAVPMKRFGAEIFVADLIGLSMLRELGPLMTAILLAGALGRRVRGGDRHDARQSGSRRADDDGPEPRPLPRDAAHPRRAAHDAAARAVLRPDRHGRRRIHDAVFLDSGRCVPEGDRQRGHDDRFPGGIREVVRVRRARRGRRLSCAACRRGPAHPPSAMPRRARW